MVYMNKIMCHVAVEAENLQGIKVWQSTINACVEYSTRFTSLKEWSSG